MRIARRVIVTACFTAAALAAGCAAPKAKGYFVFPESGAAGVQVAPPAELAGAKQELDETRRALEEARRSLVLARQGSVYEVREGDSLWKIACRKDTYGDPLRWMTIYSANSQVIRDPQRIYAGQLLFLPGVRTAAAGRPTAKGGEK